MAHSFTSILVHCIFSTKERRKLITLALQQRLFPYLGGIARDLEAPALAVGGVEDHVHVLLSLPSTLAIADAIRTLKANSSKWVHETFAQHRDFQWQEGYGAFSIGKSQQQATLRYIQNQEQRHRKMKFEDEIIAILEKHDIAYDPRFVFG